MAATKVDVAMLLLRYMGLEYGLKSIESGEFKLLRPLEANDPYEMMGAVSGCLSDVAFKELLEDMKYEFIKKSMNGSRLPFSSLEEVEARVKNNAYFIRKVVMERMIQDSHTRMLCFSDADKIDTNSDQLMWAHYAGGGSGLRVWFDTNLFPQVYFPILKVAYMEHRPIMDLSLLRSYKDSIKWNEFFKAVWQTKSLAWSYENEWRMLVPVDSKKHWVSHSCGLDFLSIPLPAITRIDFGPKGQIEDTIRRAEHLKCSDETKHIEIRVATFTEQNFTYDYLPYDDLKHVM